MTRHCEQSPPGNCFRAIDEFNRGDWFDCHETLKICGQAGWRDAGFYQGILQVAVALHHWRGGNFKGAVSLLARGAAYLRRVRPVCQRVDVSRFVAAADRMRRL
jgi:predicted metal-dependent hydrolase